jgi:hypothetical protein
MIASKNKALLPTISTLCNKHFNLINEKMIIIYRLRERLIKK